MSDAGVEPTTEASPLTMAVALRRDPIELLKMSGVAAVGLAGVPAIRWIRPSLTQEFGTGLIPNLREPSLLHIAIYAAVFLLGIVSCLLVVAIFVAAVRGMWLGRCPACGAKVMPGGNLEVSCPACDRKLVVARPS